MSVLEDAKNVLKIESNAILSLIDRLDSRFEKAVDFLFHCEGKVVVTGMGKSGQIAKKIAATFASTGTPAFFLHPAEGIHGDLGMVGREDVVLAISYSGNTEELLKILPTVKRIGAKVIGMTGRPQSELSKASDVCLSLTVPEEACPMGLAPTASTTATLALGDALAVAVLKKRNFKEADFALFHPGGTLGKRLLLKVQDIMKVIPHVPLVRIDQDMKEVLMEITGKKLGVTGVVNHENQLAGIITDGDLRRHLDNEFFLKTPIDIMTRDPKTIGADELAVQAVQIMETHKITSLFIVTNLMQPIGIIHLHDLIEAKLV
ncbi:MAG: KpsF/GutQ family sugar-phosphate isomerase [Deltaproteobacteria bacterium]|nr:KpsF/GutQ family sugar-phosphate isomerase [Deltaproteobacteria bacterium]